mgnify:CR=1 FL=1
MQHTVLSRTFAAPVNDKSNEHLRVVLVGSRRSRSEKLVKRAGKVKQSAVY